MSDKPNPAQTQAFCTACGYRSHALVISYTKKDCKIFCEKCGFLLGSGEDYLDALCAIKATL
jgi:hypothetical protein